jgi:WD40 repeat protein
MLGNVLCTSKLYRRFFAVEIPDCDDAEVYTKVLCLMYCEDFQHRLMREDINMALFKFLQERSSVASMQPFPRSTWAACIASLTLRLRSRASAEVSAQHAAKKHRHLDVNTLRGHTDSVTSLQFFNDGWNQATVCADGVVRIFRIDDTSSKSFKILRMDLLAGAHPTVVAFSEGSSSVVVAAQPLLGSSLYMYADVSAPPTVENKKQGKLSPPEIKWSHSKMHGKESVLNLAAAHATYGSGDGCTILLHYTNFLL